MRCARCKTNSLEKVPPNVLSRRRGYLCRACGARMREPGSRGVNVFVVVLGGFTVLLSLFGNYAATVGEKWALEYRTYGAERLAVAGTLVLAWGLFQLRLPEPLDAPPRRSRLWLWVLLLLLVILLLGAAWFALLYYLQEMM